MAETQNDPLLPGYSFNAHLVTGLTPIEADGYLDFFIHMLRITGYRSDPYRESVFIFCVEHCVPERIFLLSEP